jgi:mannose-6-phosphate isomerase-like protein (cupin superfamily)
VPPTISGVQRVRLEERPSFITADGSSIREEIYLFLSGMGTMKLADDEAVLLET